MARGYADEGVPWVRGDMNADDAAAGGNALELNAPPMLFGP